MDYTSGDKQTIKVVLLDIEGTTTSISFVADVLFPYARRELVSFLERTFDSAETQADIEELRKLAKIDLSSGNTEIVQIPEAGAEKSVVLDSAIKNVLAQMNSDRKTTALKQLQGHIWRHGFESGELQGDLYDDVLEAFKNWKGSIPIFIYSSGSIAAQKLLFGYNKHGNLSNYLIDHFDTTIGSKLEAESYNRIFDAIIKSGVVANLTKKEVLFATDNIKEAIAADEAGISTVVSIRPDTAPLPAEHKFHTSTSFADFWKYYNF
jgi:2,3-diketo-5-methylthio-1-phosphopentane phosphatase